MRRLEKLFHVVCIDRPDPALIDETIRGTVRGVASFAGFNATLIDGLPKLEIIALFGVGCDMVSAAYAGTRHVMVTNTPDVLTEEVADTAVGLLINTIRELPRAETWLRTGRWARDGVYRLSLLTLRDRSIGIHGLGRIGLAIARRLEAFGLPVAYHNRRPVPGVGYRYYPTLLELAAAVDTLISVVPGGPATEKVVNAAVLAALGTNGVFVNIGRGNTVDEPALAEALSNGTTRPPASMSTPMSPTCRRCSMRRTRRCSRMWLGIGSDPSRHGGSGGRQSRGMVRDRPSPHAGAGDQRAVKQIPRARRHLS